MNAPTTPDSRSRRRRIALFAALLAATIAAGVGVYGLIAGPNRPGQARPDTSATSGPAATTPGTLASTPRLPTVAESSDPETFARSVADALFTWDTASGFMPLDYTSVILRAGDPTGQEQAGLASDVAGYLPTRQAWIKLRQYATTQHLAIDRTYVPKQWAEATRQARPGQLAPGTIAYTIEGTRHRDGIWDGEAVSTEHPVTFTVFAVCAPSYDTCHLLRLSQLDNPLT